jgi:hypothetical protein
MNNNERRIPYGFRNIVQKVTKSIVLTVLDHRLRGEGLSLPHGVKPYGTAYPYHAISAAASVVTIIIQYGQRDDSEEPLTTTVAQCVFRARATIAISSYRYRCDVPISLPRPCPPLLVWVPSWWSTNNSRSRCTIYVERRKSVNDVIHWETTSFTKMIRLHR